MRVYEEDLDTLRNKIALFFPIIEIGAGLMAFFSNLSHRSNVHPIYYFLIVLGAISIILALKQYHKMSIRITVYSFTIIVTVISYASQSAMTYCFLPYLFILFSLYDMSSERDRIFSLAMIYITYMIYVGRFTFHQTLGDNNIAQVNNVQVLIPSMVVGYAISVVISRAFRKTISKQAERYVELIETQKQIISNAQIDAAKLIAGGVAHDLNNILTIITVNTYLLQSHELNEEAKELIFEIEQATKNAVQLSNQLLNFMRRNESNKGYTKIGVNKLLRETSNLVLKGSSCILDIESDEEYWVLGYYHDLMQVFQNIIINAMQSMKDSGTITIRTRLTDKFKGKKLDIEHVEISIADEGNGIAEGIDDKVFDMFFTTKKNGSGIGLAITKKILDENGGRITFESDETGTTFFVLLPKVDNISEEIIHVSEKPFSLHEKFDILIYDDNHKIIKTYEKIFSKIGLKTFCFSTSDDLLAELPEMTKTANIKMVYLDLTLPGDQSGVEIIGAIREYLPDAKYIACSGFSNKYTPENIGLNSFDLFLAKPFTIKEIENIIRNFQLESSHI